MKRDWGAEKDDRTGDSAFLSMEVAPIFSDRESFEKRLDDELMDICTHLIRDTSDTELSYSWLAHIKESPDWLTSGSPGMVKVRTLEGEKVRASNKRIVVENLTMDTLMNPRNQPARLLATGSEKWDNGMARPLYGRDFISYSIISHAL